MVVAASGILSTPRDKLADLIASSSTFQTWTGTATEAAAKAFVHQVALDADDRVRPFALVDAAQDMDGTLGSGSFARGTLEIMFEEDAATSEDPENTHNSFENNVGAIVGEMFDNSQEAGRLFLRGYRMTGATTRGSVKDADDFLRCWFEVDYGLED